MKVTLILITIAIIMFAATLTTRNSDVFSTYGFSADNFVADPFVIVSSIFLHASLIHLLSNIFAWFFFGAAVEKELGAARMLAIFFLGAFAGDLLSLLFYAPSEIAVGASAGVFALIGVGMLVKPMDLSFYPLIVPIPLVFLGVFYALYNAYAYFFTPDPAISYIAHFGGLAVGLAFGLRQTGLKKGMKLILIGTIGIILAPLIWQLIFH